VNSARILYEVWLTDIEGRARCARYWAVDDALVVALVGILEPVDRVHEA
jgi:hypothetical protein